MNESPKRGPSNPSEWTASQCSTVVAMSRTTCPPGVGDRSTGHRLRGSSEFKWDEFPAGTSSCHPSHSHEPQFWQHRRREKSLSDRLGGKHRKHFRQHQSGKCLRQPIFSNGPHPASDLIRRTIQQLSSLVRCQLRRECDGQLDGPNGHWSLFSASCARGDRNDGTAAN